MRKRRTSKRFTNGSWKAAELDVARSVKGKKLEKQAALKARVTEELRRELGR